MKKFLRLFIFYALGIIIILIILFASFLIFASISDFQPPLKASLGIKRHIVTDEIHSKELTLISWNIGYCGLGEKMDFFYEGGNQMRPDVNEFQENLNSIQFQLLHFDTVDFILLQEVDKLARRSYYFDQEYYFSKTFPDKESVFTINYKVPYIPMPVFNPMARVNSGMQLFSSYKLNIAIRYGFPASYKWPLKLFMLDRCFIYSSFSVNNGKKLVLLNIHNSAFDDADDLREVEMMFLRGIMLNEFNRGNYVIAGGDWNQNPVGFIPEKIHSNYNAKLVNKPIDMNYFPDGWTWAFDTLIPTNRAVNEPYEEGKTITTTIDYFIISPNIKLIDVKAIDLDFLFSDHQPVYMKVRLE